MSTYTYNIIHIQCICSTGKKDKHTWLVEHATVDLQCTDVYIVLLVSYNHTHVHVPVYQATGEHHLCLRAFRSLGSCGSVILLCCNIILPLDHDVLFVICVVLCFKESRRSKQCYAYSI